MAGILDGVDQRTKLAGHNRLELLLFRLAGRQRFGINVFKVQEVIQCPALTQLPGSHPVVRGIANMRGKTITVMDLSQSIGGPPLDNIEGRFVIITEYNRRIQGFLVGSVDRIVNMNWGDILPPPKGAAKGSYMTAVTRVDDELVEIIDVEKVLSEIVGSAEGVSEGVIEEDAIDETQHVLIADDSSVARNQVKRVLDRLGVMTTVCNDGKQALDQLKAWTEEGKHVPGFLALVISDVEMPVMDGYTLTTEIRKDPTLANLHIILHTSLSGVFNQTMIEKVGANAFLAKYEPDELARVVQARLKQHKLEVQALNS
ncbi:chemotaxis protein CheV [Sedimenticola selenatireducens]|jgi:two-component system chemotaxis response regulator CheV|uniref:Chemotaxis protein CheV n=1 Tax=Sedimenticola selenatireducens TaxID=191960 RepID=A0A557SCZ5_9GAMM|nr:chemotaxis protein CheV [Sedimenticola selenatireducens]TVO75273.1 chemotaxis protein CheV [Sedimenticola selenatireducens]TVT66874.1 MAG: chemotaxis protein CheV [Sedimenticola selenatireducens]